ncbi:MAG TPA: hypothetical protein VGZ29_12810, partial [Terriglobia bacterium]|nr:hypothetical protein [Terriglobia bacterium]
MLPLSSASLLAAFPTRMHGQQAGLLKAAASCRFLPQACSQRSHADAQPASWPAQSRSKLPLSSASLLAAFPHADARPASWPAQGGSK